MTVTEAIKIIQQENPKHKVLECLEFSTFYAFGLVPPGYDTDQHDAYGGAYDTVDKATGKVSVFMPTDNLEAYRQAKTIDIRNL